MGRWYSARRRPWYSGWHRPVLILYIEIPETQLRASVHDQWQARRLSDGGVPLRLVESALLLASVRRLVRSAGASAAVADSLPAYFPPVVDELPSHPRDNYVEYLRLKIGRAARDRSASTRSSEKDAP